MNTITKRTIALAVAAVAVAAAVTPSFAQTRSQRMNQMQYQEPFNSQQRWGQTWVPLHVLNAPNDCWSDEGNGRFTSCDNGSS